MKKSLIVSIIVIVLILIAGAYFLFFYTPKCNDEVCFSDKLINCKRASFISENTDTVLGYNILGASSGKCETNVKLLQIKAGNQELSGLENLDMNCFTDIGVLILPEKNLKNCHGLLKEAIQEITIERMHTQLFNNLEQIKEVEKVI